MESLFKAVTAHKGPQAGEQHSHVTRDDGTVTLCSLRAATVLSCDCCTDFGRPLTKPKEAMPHSRDGPGAGNGFSLRSLPPFTGVLRGLGLKVPHGVLFEQFWALRGRCPKLLKKHSVGHFQAQAPKHSCKWRQGSQAEG